MELRMRRSRDETATDGVWRHLYRWSSLFRWSFLSASFATFLVVPLTLAAPVAQARTSTTTIVPGGIASTTSPVTMSEISGTELTVAFTATLSATGTLTVTAEEAGRAPTYTLRAPAGATITASTVTLRAETSVSPGKTVAGPLPPAVQIVVSDRAGTPIARCAPAVAGTSATTVTIPATCQAPGTTVTLYPLSSPATQTLPPITPRTLPNTGMGGTSRLPRVGVALATLSALLGFTIQRQRQTTDKVGPL